MTGTDLTGEALDHRALLAGLTPETRRELTALSDTKGAVATARHFGVLVVSGVAIAWPIPGWWLLLVPHGLVLIFLFTLLHETSHQTVFRTAWVNRVVGLACGFVVFLPPLWFRYFHLAHHRHTHDPKHDPELASPKPEGRWAYLLHISGLPVWRSQIVTLVDLARGHADAPYLPVGARPRIVAEARMLVAAYAVLTAGSIALGSAVLVWIWLVPALLGQPFLRLYLLAEHGRCPHVANMLANTRTTFTNRIVRTLAWNMPYHAEHHAYPSVPFHRLPDFHVIARKHLLETEQGYARFNRRYWAAIASEA